MYAHNIANNNKFVRYIKMKKNCSKKTQMFYMMLTLSMYVSEMQFLFNLYKKIEPFKNKNNTFGGFEFEPNYLLN